MIEIAAAAGADAIKFQSFKADGLASKRDARGQYDFFRRFELNHEDHARLARACADAGIDFLSTPFDFESANLLDNLGVPAFKVASCDLTNLPLIEHIAKFGKPMFISTGMGNIEEVIAARDAALSSGSPEVTMLHCTTLYPTPYSAANLNAISTMKAALGTPVGFSDHTVGNWACYAAVALGAAVIEKHFALDKSMDGPDIPGSCDPKELADLVAGIHAISESLGSGEKGIAQGEDEMVAIARRSVYSAIRISKGESLTADHLAYKRPGDGISPADAALLIGKRALQDIEPDTKLDWKMLG
ncbi:MAG: N-acetylneuraminate synthase family protein [bacterium]